jgi:hypothetical protein
MPTQLSPAVITIIAAAVGGGVASLFTFLSAYLNGRAEERKQIRALAVQVALEHYKISLERTKGGPQHSYHTDMNWINVYLIQAAHLVSALDGSLKTPEQVREYLTVGFSKIKIANETQIEQSKPQVVKA